MNLRPPLTALILLASATAACAAREGVVDLPVQPGTSRHAGVAWSPDGRTVLASLAGEYITKPGFLVTTQVGPMANAYFILDAAGNAEPKPFLRASSCRFLPDGRILALNYAPFDTKPEDVEKISLSPAREKNTKAAGIFTPAGEFVKETPVEFAGTPSPDGKRFLLAVERDGQNNYYCHRKLAVRSETEAPVDLAPPGEEKPGRLVGFRECSWIDDSRILACVVDMDANKARSAPPGMWLDVEPAWYLYSLAAKTWEKLDGDKLIEATARRVEVEGGTIYFMPDSIKLVRGPDTKTLAWPELRTEDLRRWVFSPDGTYGIVQLVSSSHGAPGRGAAPSGFGAPSGPPAAKGADDDKSPLGLWLVDMSKPSKMRMDFPEKKGDPGAESFAAMGWIGSGSFALVQYEARSTVVNARGVVVSDIKGASYRLHALSGRPEAFTIEGIPWQPFLLERSAHAKERLAILVRQGPGSPDAQEFRVGVVGPKGEARRMVPPAGFPVGYTSGLWLSPDGRTLVVSGSKSPRLWFATIEKEQ